MTKHLLKAKVLCLVLLTTSCTIQTPDLPRLYGFPHTGESKPTPIILIHGTFGSRLVTPSGEEVWPGKLRQLLFSNYRDLALEIDPVTLTAKKSDLLVSGTTDQIAGSDYYGKIKTTLETVGQFQITQPGTPVADNERRYYVFEYDWRLDNLSSVRSLHKFLDQIRSDHNDESLKFDVIAHSMGGLIVRYFARYGSVDELTDNDFPVTGTGATYLRRVALLGTPNLGSVMAVANVTNGMKVGFDRIPTDVLISFPSGYQLLPHPIVNWLVTSDGEPFDHDIFDMEFWQKTENGVFNPAVRQTIRQRYATAKEADEALVIWERFFHRTMERARRFVWSLTVPANNLDLEYLVIGGDCQRTPNKVVIEPVGTKFKLQTEASTVEEKHPGIDYEELMTAPGDGTVTKASLLARQVTNPRIPRHQYSFFPLKYPIFFCEKHTRLTSNIAFQDNLMHFLLSEDYY